MTHERSEQYNNKDAVIKLLERYQAKLLKKTDKEVIYQSLNTGYIIKVSRIGYLYKVDYYKTCGICDK